MLNWILKGCSHEGRAADPPACRDQLSVQYGSVQASRQWNTLIKFGKEVSSSARQKVLLEKARSKEGSSLDWGERVRERGYICIECPAC